MVVNRFVSPFRGSIVAQFNKLKQTGTVLSYIHEFEKLRALMKERTSAFTDEYFLESFIGGLKDEIGRMVALQEPTSLLKATQLAVQSKELIQLLTKGHKYGVKPSFSPSTGVNKAKGVNFKSKLPPIKRLTPEEVKARREKNLCFNCDDTYHAGHRCKKLYMILADDHEEENGITGDTQILDVSEVESKDPQISLNAVNGQIPTNIIKLLGKSAGCELVILLDSGSTHSFLDYNTAKRLGCVIEFTSP